MRAAATRAFGSFSARQAAAWSMALILAVTIIPSMAGPAGAVGTFEDDDGNVHESNIEKIAAVGITFGCNPPANTLYCPDDFVTREQMASFLVRTLGLGPGPEGQFTDISGSVHANDINSLAASGITKGCNPPANDRYCPNDVVTRGQMAAFMTRGLGLDPTTDDFFTDDDNSIFEAEINSIAKVGITRGCNPPQNDRYCPDNPVRRDEMASFLARVYDIVTTGTTSTTTPGTTSSTTTTTTVPGPCSTTAPSEPSITPTPFGNAFSTHAGGLCDKGDTGTGFTWVDPPSNGTGYIRPNLEVTDGELRVTSTSGLFEGTENTQDNALAIGLEPQTNWKISTTLVNPATPNPGNFQQAGLWFGNDEDNHVKLVVVATQSQGPRVQLRSEVNASQGFVRNANVPDLSSSRIDLELYADSINLEVTGRFRINGGAWQSMGTPFSIPVEFFTVDQAGGTTKSFAGIMTSHRNAPSPIVYRFDSFGVSTFESEGGGGPSGPFAFTAIPETIAYKPTGMEWGPDNRLYVLGSDGAIRRYLVNANGTVQLEATEVVLPALPSGQTYAALGLALDPASTSSNITAWVTSSVQGGTNFMEGVKNSSTVWRIQNLKGSWTRTAMITGLPRAFENHAINNLHFHPTTNELYIAMGGNTGAGEANSKPGSAFGTRPEQPLSAAWLKANVKKAGGWSPSNDGDCETFVDDGPPPSVHKTIPSTCSVQRVATGLRNMYDFVFHRSGRILGVDNGLGIEGTVPETYQPDCRGYIDPYIPPGEPGSHDPGPQPDPLHELISGKYYGHPNPSRDECVFFDGTFQSNLHNTAVAPLPDWKAPLKNLNVVGQQGPRSLNGIIEYKSTTHFGGAFDGHLVITAFAGGGAGQANGWQGVYRVDLGNLAVCSSSQNNANPCAQKATVTTASGAGYGWNQPLPIQQISNGRLAVGEFVGRTTAGGRLVVLIPKS